MTGREQDHFTQPVCLPVMNAAAYGKVVRVGQRRSPVFVLDDALANAIEIKAWALRARLSPETRTLYPGLTASVDTPIIQPVIRQLGNVLVDVFGVPAGYKANCYGYLGLITTPEQELSVTQSVPHYDVISQACLALLIYLSDTEQGGTGFYRHRGTGFETVGHGELAEFSAAIEPELAQRAQMPRHYVRGSDNDYECIGEVEGRFNRLIIYNGNLLHSAHVDPLRLSSDPSQGRLTLNIFATN